MRERMIKGAVNLFKELHYCGAATIEFLVEGENFYFMEVNARIQVEHPVSEFVTGLDLIRQQILACTGEKLELSQEMLEQSIARGNGWAALKMNGCAMECRINALGPGKVTNLTVPGGPGVRFDSFLYTGYTVPPFYDAMVAKLIVHAPTRERALARMDRALGELVIEGFPTNQKEQREIINNKTFRSGNYGTSFYEIFKK
jgi:acetyl-CoA carboxylase biotin carboxylase subunit